MESIYTELALYGSKDESARTANVFCPYLRSAIVGFPLLNSVDKTCSIYNYSLREKVNACFQLNMIKKEMAPLY